MLCAYSAVLSAVPALDSTADLILRSVDGLTLHVHKKNLAQHSNIFGDAAGFSGSDDAEERKPDVEEVPLTEKGDILELLLQFMYRRAQPDVSELDFDQAFALAEAAEKYQVFSATQVCRMSMGCVLQLCLDFLERD